jgi:alpha-tubulin suppressor-like RCC1 family protein
VNRYRKFVLRLGYCLPWIVCVGACQVILGIGEDGTRQRSQDGSETGLPNAGAAGALAEDADASSSVGGHVEHDASVDQSSAGAGGALSSQAGNGGSAGSSGSAGDGSGGGSIELNDHRLAVGEEHVCAVRKDAAVYCFGNNKFGQRGNGEDWELTGTELLSWTRTLEITERPLSVSGVRAGATSTCGTRPGEVWCWGENKDLQAGRGLRQPGFEQYAVLVPMEEPEPNEERDAPEIVSGSSHVCAIDYDIWCWGNNQYGQINGDSTKSLLLPSIINYEQEMVGYAFGDGFSLGLVGRGGAVQCWGRDDYGQCGNQPEKSTCLDDSEGCILEPTEVLDVGFTQAVFAGARHACAITALDKVRCWGHNDAGQASPVAPCTAAANCSVSPTDVTGVEGASTLALGEHHSCAKVDEGVWCWGKLDVLGAGPVSSSGENGPAEVLRTDGQPLTGVIAIAAHASMTCAMTEPENVWCWGYGPGGNYWPLARQIPW